MLLELNEKLSIEDFRSLALDLKKEIYNEEDIKKINEIIESSFEKDTQLKRA